MKDLKKMREDFEKQYARQEMANNLELKYGTGIEFYIFERFRGDGLLISAHHCGDLRNEPISMELAKRLLEDFPADEKQLLNDTARGTDNPIHGFYTIRAIRGYSDNFTTLKVSWLCKGNEYNFGVKIDENKALEPFFHSSTRKMDGSERSTYHPMRRGHLVKDMDLPIMRFHCAHITYQGGMLACTDLDAIDQIISVIKDS